MTIEPSTINKASEQIKNPDVITQDEKKKVPFMQCLKHETKTAYKYYLIGIATFAVMMLVGYGMFLAWGIVGADICGGVTAIGNTVSSGFDAVIAFLVSVPWYVYAGIGLVAAPLIWSLVVCTVRRMSALSVAALVMASLLSVFFFMIIEMSNLPMSMRLFITAGMWFILYKIFSDESGLI